MISEKLLSVLACPNCKGGISYSKQKNAIECGKCRLRFKVLEGDIPDMLIEDAEKF